MSSRAGSRIEKMHADDDVSLRQVSNTLSAERREKLIALRDRERMNDVLLQKFGRKYGPDRIKTDDDTHSVPESVLQNEVSNFVDKAALTEDNLARLERRMRRHATKKNNCPEDVKSIISAYSQATKASEGDHPLQFQRRMEPLEGIAEEPPCDWGKLDEYAKLLHQREDYIHQIAHVEKQKLLKTELDKQIEAARERKKQQQESDQKCHETLIESLAKWKVDEKMKEEEIKNKAMKEKEGRDLQLELDKQTREEETERKRQDDEHLLRLIATNAVVEKEEKLKKKEQNRDLWHNIHVEHEREKQIKKELLKQEREQDIEYNREFDRIFVKQETRKKNERQTRLDRQDARVQHMESTVSSGEKNKALDEEIRIAKTKKEMEKKQLEVERNKEDKMNRMRLDTQDFLLQQMEDHKEKKLERQRSKQAQAELIEQDNLEYSRIKNKETEEKRRRNVNHKQELQNEIDRRRERKSEVMSTHEIAINRGLLKKIGDVFNERRILVEGE